MSVTVISAARAVAALVGGADEDDAAELDVELAVDGAVGVPWVLDVQAASVAAHAAARARGSRIAQPADPPA
jgi:hypothetical protein